MEINDIILEEANKDLNKKEIRGNKGWEDPELQKMMESTGWSIGQSWCAYWLEKVWVEAYSRHNPYFVSIIQRLFSANAVATWRAFQQSQFITSKVPVPGAGVIWMKKRNGSPVYLTEDQQWIAGHAGICIEGNESHFVTYEGNSNDEGGREGIEVAKLTRQYNYDADQGLVLLGFIHPLK